MNSTASLGAGQPVWVWLNRAEWTSATVVTPPFTFDQNMCASVALEHGVVATLEVRFILPREPHLDGADRPQEGTL